MASIDETWGTIPQAERREWCAAFLDFPPSWQGTIFMIGTQMALNQGRYSTIRVWVDLARQLARGGFTARDFYTLRLCLSLEKIRAELAREGGSDLIVDTQKYPNTPETISLVAGAWAMWPELVRSGMSPLRATNLILSRGESRMPNGFLMMDGKIVYTTDD